MSSNIRLQRICQHCGNEFTAKTTVTKYCSSVCSKRAYKTRKRSEKINKSSNEIIQIKKIPIEELHMKEFLSVKDTAALLGSSARTVYRMIDSGVIKAVNLADRMTRIRRSELNKLLDPVYQSKPELDIEQIDINDCYNLTEIQDKYGISEKALHDLIKRNKIPKIKKGWYAYVPKNIIDDLLS